jgi:hypothetical protein
VGLTKGQLHRTTKQLEQKTREADDWAREYWKLSQQARAAPDTQVKRQAETLVRQGKLREADRLLNPPVISMAQYHAIQLGMGYPEVVKILGGPGVEKGSGGNSMIRAATYLWQNTDGSLVMIAFLNDEVQHKTQSGLR